MMEHKILKWGRLLLSGKDNATPDLARYSWLLANIAVIAAAAISLVKGVPISLTELATALAIANTSAAAATKIKETTEPEPGTAR